MTISAASVDTSEPTAWRNDDSSQNILSLSSVPFWKTRKVSLNRPVRNAGRILPSGLQFGAYPKYKFQL